MRRRGAKKIVIMVLVTGLVVWVGSGKGLGPVAAATSWIISPFTSALSGLGRGTGGFFSTIGSIRSLSERNSNLEHEVAKLKQQLARSAELRQENIRLTKQLGFSEPAESRLVPAQVIAYQPDNFRQFITIGRGRADGIKEGMAVVSDGVLVGKISEVLPFSSKVFVISDPSFRISGLDQETRATGTVRGQIGSGLIMEKIAQSDQIKPGDTIITSGLGAELPKGLIIGKVESVNQKDNAVFQSALITTGLNMNRLELVFVVVQ